MTSDFDTDTVKFQGGNAEVFKVHLVHYLEEVHRVRRPNVSLGITPGSVSVDTAGCRMYFRVMPRSAVGWGKNTLVVCRCDCRDWQAEDYVNFLQFLVNIQGLEYEQIGFESFDRLEPLLLYSRACPSDFSGNFLMPRAHLALCEEDSSAVE